MSQLTQKLAFVRVRGGELARNGAMLSLGAWLMGRRHGGRVVPCMGWSVLSGALLGMTLDRRLGMTVDPLAFEAKWC